MAGEQQGFLYERNASEFLKKHGVSTGAVAGASHDKPDLELYNPIIKKKAGCELKISPTAAGSLVLKYHGGTWQFGKYEKDAEKEFMVSVASKVNLLNLINTKWGGTKVPFLQNNAAGKKIYVLTDRKENYKNDMAQYGGANEIHVSIPANIISAYYNSKNTFYINVGTHGFYTMNSKDPLGLNNALRKMKAQIIPDFGNAAFAKIRCRVQAKGSGDYQFVMTLEFNNVTKSPYNVAPLVGKTSVTIAKEVMNSPNNKALMAALRYSK